MNLLDLPPELLDQILHELGGSALRRGVGSTARLTLCRKWCASAQPVFLSGINFAHIQLTNAKLFCFEKELNAFDSRYSMNKNTRKLHVRLLNHPWYAETSEIQDPWGDHVDWATMCRIPTGRVGFYFGNPELPAWKSEEKSGEWRLKLNEKLVRLFGGLDNFAALEKFALEATSDGERDALPPWDYLHAETLHVLLDNLPLARSLRCLVLDTCGSIPVDVDGADSKQHMCSAVAKIIPQVENVRLRMRKMCPELLDIPKTDAACVRLRKLILKTHQPFFPPAPTMLPVDCGPESIPSGDPLLHKRIIDAVPKFLSLLSRMRSCGHSLLSEGDVENVDTGRRLDHGLKKLRVSYVEDVELKYMDCLTMTIITPWTQFCHYEDDGTPCWFEEDDQVSFMGALGSAEPVRRE